jgi:hypothetical protein
MHGGQHMDAILHAVHLPPSVERKNRRPRCADGSEGSAAIIKLVGNGIAA